MSFKVTDHIESMHFDYGLDVADIGETPAMFEK